MSDLNGLQRLYRLTAPHYQRDIITVFSPLVEDFAYWVVRCASSRLDYTLSDPFDSDMNELPLKKLSALATLDLGTGTGLLPQQLSPYITNIIGLDTSADMLLLAQGPHNFNLVQADNHKIPLRSSSISLVVSTFGLNASTPKPLIRSVLRILKRGEGMFAFQEWGAEDECSRIIDEIVSRYLDNIEGISIDETLNAFYEAPKPWYDQLQDSDDFYNLLKSLGFRYVWAKEAAFVAAHFESPLPFIRYKLAWPARQAALTVMSSSMRAAFESDLLNALEPYTRADGSFDWSPMMFRVFAHI
jgi:ubiquinone/menaquinone biosynthesis C-methylase UbiE